MFKDKDWKKVIVGGLQNKQNLSRMNCPCNPEKFHQEWATMWSSWNWLWKILFFCGQVLAPKEDKSKCGQWRRAASLKMEIRDISSKSSPNPHASAWKRSVGKEGGWVAHRAVSASWYRSRHESPTNTTRGTLSQIQPKPAGPPKIHIKASRQAHQSQHYASQQDQELDQEESDIEVIDLRDSEVIPQHKLWSDPASKCFFITGNQTHVLSRSNPDQSLCKRTLWRKPATVNQCGQPSN